MAQYGTPKLSSPMTPRRFECESAYPLDGPLHLTSNEALSFIQKTPDPYSCGSRHACGCSELSAKSPEQSNIGGNS